MRRNYVARVQHFNAGGTVGAKDDGNASLTIAPLRVSRKAVG